MSDPADPPRLYRPSLRRRALDRAIRPTRAEIDLAGVRHNFSVAQQAAGGAQILAVVKANAYGHGAVLVAHALREAGATFLAVALVEEGLELRNAGIDLPILVLGGSYDGGYDLLVEAELIPTVFRPEHLVRLGAAAKAAGRSVLAHLKVDTGMGRIGVRPEELAAFLDEARRHPQVRLDGVLTHFANADLSDPQLTARQVASFEAAVAQVVAAGHSPRYRHLSNSAAVLSRPELRGQGLVNLVRPGLLLYGLAPAQWLAGRAPLIPVLTWKTAITHLKRVPEGTPVSYGSTWTSERESVIATLPVGYADGYSRHNSSRASVIVRGQRVPIVGRVCMDMCMADVTDVPAVDVGDEVVLLGRQGQAQITAEELASISDTIHYEILCSVGARVPRRPA